MKKLKQNGALKIVKSLIQPSNKITEAKTLNFEFRSEKPKDGNLLFGHDEIVSALEKIVLKSPESFTIGLYGNWGVGKSSIAEALQNKLKEKDIPLIIFDVWKHEGDSLRRTFLKDIDYKLKGDKFGERFYKNDFHLEANLEKDIVIETHKGYKIDYNKIIKYSLAFIGIVVIPFLILAFGLLGISKLLYTEGFSVQKLLFDILKIGIPATFLFKLFESVLIIRKETEKREKFQDPIEFEESFNGILENLQSNIEKIVIVFDNLDRVSGEKAVEIISTIKTFLEPIDKKNTKKNIVFIIPCDANAIKNHLRKVFGNNNNSNDDDNFHQYADEYLRKFFNTIIWIPEFYDTELQKLAYNELKETKIPDLDNLDLAGLIILVFDQNPRQIIQFINILVANYILLKERNISGFSLTNNVVQLAKYLLLVQKFPDFMDIYRTSMIYDLDEDVNIIGQAEENEGNNKNLRYYEFKEFLALTKDYHIESLDVFFKFRLTEFENTFENSTRLIKILQSNRVSEILNSEPNTEDKNLLADKEYLIGLSIKTKEIEFNNIVKQKVKDNIYPNIIIQFLNGVFVCAEHFNLELFDDVTRAIYNKIGNEKVLIHIYRINPSTFLNVCINKIKNTTLKESFLKLLKSQWIKDFVYYHKNDKDKIPENYINNILNLLISKPEIFDLEETQEVPNIIAKFYLQRNDIIEKVTTNEILREKYGSEELLTNLLDGFKYSGQEKSINNFDEFIKFISVVNDLINYLTDSLINHSLIFLEKAMNYLFNEESNENQKMSASDELFKLKKHTITILKYDKLNVETLKKYYNILRTFFVFDHYRYSPFLIDFLLVFKEAKQNLENTISYKEDLKHFFNSATPFIIKDSIKNSFYLNILENEKELYNIILIRAKQDYGFIEIFEEDFNINDYQNIIEWWLPSSSKRTVDDFIKVLDIVKYNPPNEIQLANKIISDIIKIGGLDDKRKLIDGLFKLTLNSNRFDYSSLKQHIAGLIKSENIQSHEFGLSILEKYKSLFTEIEVQTLLKEAFLILIKKTNQFHVQLTNLLSKSIGISRKSLNEIWNNDISNLSTSFIINNKLIPLLKNLLEKLNSNHKNSFVNELLIKLEVNIKGNPPLIINFIEILKIIVEQLTYDILLKSRNSLVYLTIQLLNNVNEENCIDLGVNYNKNISIYSFPDLPINNKLWEIYNKQEHLDKKYIPELKEWFKIDKGKLEIKEAIYYTAKGEIDVKEALSNKITGNILIAFADNLLNGDPEYGVKKELKIQYRKNVKGKYITEKYKENELIFINL